MTNDKMARIRKCQSCEHWLARTVKTHKWPQCDAGQQLMNLDNASLEGDASTCPLGYWVDLTPVDFQAEVDANRAKSETREVEKWKRITGALLPNVKTPEEMRTNLTRLVAAGEMRPEIAAKVEARMVIGDGIRNVR